MLIVTADPCRPQFLARPDGPLVRRLWGSGRMWANERQFDAKDGRRKTRAKKCSKDRNAEFRGHCFTLGVWWYGSGLYSPEKSGISKYGFRPPRIPLSTPSA